MAVIQNSKYALNVCIINYCRDTVIFYNNTWPMMF